MSHHLINKLENRYDAENDVNPEWPNINWAERDLLTLVEWLADKVEKQQKEIDMLRQEITGSDGPSEEWLAALREM